MYWLKVPMDAKPKDGKLKKKTRDDTVKKYHASKRPISHTYIYLDRSALASCDMPSPEWD